LRKKNLPITNSLKNCPYFVSNSTRKRIGTSGTSILPPQTAATNTPKTAIFWNPASFSPVYRSVTIVCRLSVQTVGFTKTNCVLTGKHWLVQL